MSKPENPFAFPMGNPEQGGYDGMTLRDHFAGQALVGLLSSGKWHNDGEGFEDFIAMKAGNIADAMLAERVKGGA